MLSGAPASRRPERHRIIRALMTTARIKDLPRHVGEKVTLNGWLYNKRTSGKLQFPIIRDGSGFVQCVVSKKEVAEESWNDSDRATQESTVQVTGNVVAEARAPGGVEMHVSEFKLTGLAEPYPISPKEHGTAFLMDLRHLWLRSSKQHAVLRVRNEIEKGIRDFFYDRDFVLIDSPILTANAAEGTSTLFETDYFGQKAYLSQSGQLYLEPAAAAFGKVYCFGPTFRAEKSKTRRHLMEFWMLEPEAAFYSLEDLMAMEEQLLGYVVERVLEKHRPELAILERDISRLENIKAPFARISYDEAVERLQKLAAETEDPELKAQLQIPWGEDFGSPHETAIAEMFDRP